MAEYPFTTLQPNLGVVQLSGSRTFVLADIPGIIEGAHEGKGLGLQFLRHIERTRLLAFLVPADIEDPAAALETLRAEVEEYSEELAGKPHCAVVSKADLLGPDDEAPAVPAAEAWGTFLISAVSGQGLDEWKEAMWARVREALEEEQAEDEEPWRP